MAVDLRDHRKPIEKCPPDPYAGLSPADASKARDFIAGVLADFMREVPEDVESPRSHVVVWG
jgi:hypothetical protein